MASISNGAKDKFISSEDGERCVYLTKGGSCLRKTVEQDMG